MGCLIAQTAQMSQNGLAARTATRLVQYHVLASQDPVHKFVTVLPHVLTCGMSRLPPVRLTMCLVLVMHARMAVGVFLQMRCVTQSYIVIVARMRMNTNVK